MAISFSRPDPSSPAAVGSAAFPVNRRGFDQGEVRDFLRMVAAELARLQEREKFLESELRTMQTRGMSAPGRLDEETVTTLLGEEAARVLSTARDASAQIRERAEESATRLVKDAAEDAARIRESAQIEAARIHEDAVRDAEQEIEMAKQQGRDMVNEARAYREKVLSELSRRRDAARSQIEQLLHGRDRLLNAFERARIASEDVINGLTDAHDEPEFIVDLSPTTGPVPIINPEHPSVKPFNREDEDVVTEAVIEVVLPVVEVEPTDTVVHAGHEEEVVQEEVIEDIVVDLIDSIAPVESQQHEEVSELAVDNSVEIDIAEVEIPVAQIEDDASQTNVVSLFGRGRRTEEVPEIVEAEPEVAHIEVVEPVSQETEASSPVDDIFARLREGTVADVAAQTTEASTRATKKSSEKTSTEQDEKPARKAALITSDPALFTARDESLSSVVSSMARKMKRVLADEQNEVLQHLRTKKSSLEMDAFLGSATQHAQRYVAAVTEELMTAAGAGAKSVKTSGGSSRRVTQKAITEHVASSIVEGFIAKFRDDTRVAIGEAEGDRDILAGLMRDVYRAWKMDLLDQNIEDVANCAYGKGGFLALEPGAQISWMVDPTSPCCSECEDNSLAGALAKGSEFPTGHSFAPAHSGCRCLVHPVQD